MLFMILFMDLNVSSIVRSLAIAAVGFPVALGVSGTLGSVSEAITASVSDTVTGAEVTKVQNDVRSDLAKTCLSYLLSKNDSKLERQAKDELDEYFGGNVNHGEVCKWVIQ